MGILVGNVREGKMSRKEQAIVYLTVEITGVDESEQRWKKKGPLVTLERVAVMSLANVG